VAVSQGTGLPLRSRFFNFLKSLIPDVFKPKVNKTSAVNFKESTTHEGNNEPPKLRIIDPPPKTASITTPKVAQDVSANRSKQATSDKQPESHVSPRE
jgi:hypothetical protein